VNVAGARVAIEVKEREYVVIYDVESSVWRRQRAPWLWINEETFEITT